MVVRFSDYEDPNVSATTTVTFLPLNFEPIAKYIFDLLASSVAKATPQEATITATAVVSS